MRGPWLRCALLLGLALGGGRESWAAPNAVRFWILPFENAARHGDLANVSHAATELLTLFVSKAGKHSVVEREHLDRILAEHALSRDGLVAPARRARIGRLLGATAMITGSCAREGKRLLVMAHVTDIASGRVRASARAVGTDDRLAETIQTLYENLVKGLLDSRPAPSESQAEPTPLQNLHFLRGLSYFYSARYTQALAELIQCGPDAEQDGLPGLWRANCYLAREEYDHAYLELIRLKRNGLASAGASEHEEKLRVCLAHLAPEDVQAYDRLLSAGKKR